jgi:hypothetical protein
MQISYKLNLRFISLNQVGDVVGCGLSTDGSVFL